MSKQSDKSKIEENLLLKAKIALKGGMLKFSGENELPDDIENQFLQNVLDFEDAPVKPVSEILGTCPEDWADEKDIDDEELEEKLVIINALFKKHNMEISLNENVPLRVMYTFLTREFLTHEITVPFGGMTLHIDGCDGNCKECFQLPYCDSGREILGNG